MTSRGAYSAKHAHGINIVQREVFVFRVKACYDVVLELKRKYGEHTDGTPRNVRVVLGLSKNDGDKSLIAFVNEDGETDMDFPQNTPDILSCYTYKPFWFSWKVSNPYYQRYLSVVLYQIQFWRESNSVKYFIFDINSTALSWKNFDACNISHLYISHKFNYIDLNYAPDNKGIGILQTGCESLKNSHKSNVHGHRH